MALHAYLIKRFIEKILGKTRRATGLTISTVAISSVNITV